MRGKVRNRWTPFILVGALGFILQLVALALLTRAGLPYPAATTIAVELAILHNFLWHERWTWRDRPAAGIRARFQQFLRFNGASGVVSVAGNVLLTALLVERGGLPLSMANALAVAVLSALNFALADRWVFASRESPPRPQEAATSAAPSETDNSRPRCLAPRCQTRATGVVSG